MSAIHQIVAGFRRNDAIANTALLWRGILRGWGRKSEIFCEMANTAPEQRHEVRDLEMLAAACSPNDVVVLHLSIGCAANVIFERLKCRKVILYHNVTPARFFERINTATASRLAEGRSQAAALAGVAELNLADSAYNASELVEMGYSDVGVLPLLIDLEGAHREVSQPFMERFGDGAVNILFVGRVAPNKRHDELLRVFHDFQHAVEPRSRLVIAGSTQGCELYTTLLAGMRLAFELKRVVFTGSLSQPELNACYRTATVFLCMSEHEGFCAPLLEAMHHDVPVLAVADAAVPETMDGAGILFGERDHALIAETLGRVVRDREFREAVLDGQRKRIARYRARDYGKELLAALAPVLS